MMDREHAGVLLQGLAPQDELVQFVRALVEAAYFPRDWEGMDTLLDFLEKPWKWSGEFVAWDAAGRPMDASEHGWEAFVKAAAEA